MPPPNNPPLPPLPAVDHAGAASAPRANDNNPPPPPPEESRFEAALCLMNLVQRPLGTSATVTSPSAQPTTQSSLPVIVNPSSSSIVGSTSQQSTTKPPPPKKKKRIRLNYICTHPNCTNLVRKSGVCIRHGAQVKLCSYPNCHNHAKNGGVCRRHGASRPCGRGGCGNMVVKGGLCIKHWREEFDVVHQGGDKSSSRVEFVRMQQMMQSGGEEREREIAVAKLLVGQRGGNI